MPKARSGKQQMVAGAALSAKRGERSKSSLKGASKQMDERGGAPQHVERHSQEAAGAQPPQERWLVVRQERRRPQQHAHSEERQPLEEPKRRQPQRVEEQKRRRAQLG
jgi:hypothetical protein